MLTRDIEKRLERLRNDKVAAALDIDRPPLSLNRRRASRRELPEPVIVATRIGGSRPIDPDELHRGDVLILSTGRHRVKDMVLVGGGKRIVFFRDRPPIAVGTRYTTACPTSLTQLAEEIDQVVRAMSTPPMSASLHQGASSRLPRPGQVHEVDCATCEGPCNDTYGHGSSA
ncbi:hypothetical protein [Streptomyces sp. CB03238]|uniref:hypothetical protein n=1 Tax=Streptomyces sp. CB03238 TaxID=1907777 RepID=UPI000A11429F|nr:hypothetical protein [Streptomyces sp. CB03238]ORT58149.1 hypothetical protein BKD26_19805 [Streptomyces sp. CB03238]